MGLLMKFLIGVSIFLLGVVLFTMGWEPFLLWSFILIVGSLMLPSEEAVREWFDKPFQDDINEFDWVTSMILQDFPFDEPLSETIPKYEKKLNLLIDDVVKKSQDRRFGHSDSPDTSDIRDKIRERVDSYSPEKKKAVRNRYDNIDEINEEWCRIQQKHPRCIIDNIAYYVPLPYAAEKDGDDNFSETRKKLKNLEKMFEALKEQRRTREMVCVPTGLIGPKATFGAELEMPHNSELITVGEWEKRTGETYISRNKEKPVGRIRYR